MRALYLTNNRSNFNTLIPEALEMQSIEVTVRTSPVEATIKADVIISDRYPHKIPEHICDQFADKSVNLHSSMLPRYRGSYPILFSVLAGEDPGWSLHKIDRVIDHGEVLFQKHVHTRISAGNSAKFGARQPGSFRTTATEIPDRCQAIPVPRMTRI